MHSISAGVKGDRRQRRIAPGFAVNVDNASNHPRRWLAESRQRNRAVAKGSRLHPVQDTLAFAHISSTPRAAPSISTCAMRLFSRFTAFPRLASRSRNRIRICIVCEFFEQREHACLQAEEVAGPRNFLDLEIVGCSLRCPSRCTPSCVFFPPRRGRCAISASAKEVYRWARALRSSSKRLQPAQTSHDHPMHFSPRLYLVCLSS